MNALHVRLSGLRGFLKIAHKLAVTTLVKPRTHVQYSIQDAG